MRTRRPCFLAVLAAIGASVWSCNRPVAKPGITDLTALDASGAVVRQLGNPPTLARNEALDFHVELSEPGYVYVFRVAGDRAQLEWGPGAGAPPLEKGRWAPEWQDERVKGLHFPEGDGLLYVLATSKPLGELQGWTKKDLEQPATRCERCSSTALSFKVTPATVSADAGVVAQALPDAGTPAGP